MIHRLVRFSLCIFIATFASASRAEGANDGIILLHASAAIVHGKNLRFEPQPNKNTLGYWTLPTDWAEWKFTVDRPGVFDVEVWQGCGKGNGGSDVRVEVAGQTIDFVVDETGHFQSFIPRKLGRVHFWKAGDYTLALKPQNKKAAAVMDCRQVRLIPRPQTGWSELESALLNSRRTIFLGDSITYSGEYIEFLETYLRLKNPEAEFDLINLGLPSETVSGLSEPGHAGGQFPRPDLHERLDRVLAQTHPDLIIACYGMNDGIYYPLSEERFAKFRDGIEKLREKAAAAGAKVIHLTPPVFDPAPIKDRTLPAGLDEYRKPFEAYNIVLDTYSEWLISKHADDWVVIDIHGPMNWALEDRRKIDPNFHFAGDGVHPSKEGHWVIAQTLLGTADELTNLWQNISPRGAELLDLVQKRQRLRKDAWLTVTGHKRPGMHAGKPLDEAESEAADLSAKIAAIQDPQLPGKRILWNGFETTEFTFNEKPIRIVPPKRAFDFFKPCWPIDALELTVTNAHILGAGFYLLAGATDDNSDLDKTLLNFGLERVRGTAPKLATPRDEEGRPLIRKFGAIDLDLVETTPVVISNRLWRFEWVREGYWDNKRKTNYFRFRDPATREVTEPFADGHEFGSAFVHDGAVYVTGTHDRGEVNIFSSRDLKTWEKWNAIPAGKYGIFNTSLCKAGDGFVMMFEIDKPAEEAGRPFTARFTKSRDLHTWMLTPPECNYAKDRYTAPHCLRWLDGYFYDFYLEANDGYEMRVVRSRDLIHWDASPLNPVLRASPEDHRIANATMPDSQRTRVANAADLNNSDIDFCEQDGRLHITYSWGNQQGIEHLAEAIFDGSEREFLLAWFP